jgi:5-methylthioadenosine/S-adenosylhomocysteine deaminase
MDEPDEEAHELLIEGAAVLPSAAGEWRESAAVLARDGLVVEIGEATELAARHPAAERAGGATSLVLPGLINAHQHAEGVSTTQMGFADEPFELWMVLMHSLPSVDPYITTLFK